MSKITYCIPCKNNLRYLKGSIQSIKENSLVECEVVVYLDANEDGAKQWLIDNGVRYIENTDKEPKGIAYAYNRCIEAAKSDVVCMFHADMYMGKGFDVNLLKHLKPKTVIAATRIEPPLHPAGKEKIVENFGMYPEDFKKSEFDVYVQNLNIKNKDVTSRGIFAPWLTYRSELMEIGMHDEKLHSYYEDSDIFQRMLLNGCKMIQSWDSLVYHFTCRGGQFQDGIEKVTSDPKFHQMKDRSARHYIRKWGSWIQNDEYQHPILFPNIDIGFVVKAKTIPFLRAVEPWAKKIYIDDLSLVKSYISSENGTSTTDLMKKVMTDTAEDQIYHSVVLFFSEEDFTKSLHENMYVIQNISSIVRDSFEPNQIMELGIFKMKTQGEYKDLSKTREFIKYE